MPPRRKNPAIFGLDLAETVSTARPNRDSVEFNRGIPDDSRTGVDGSAFLDCLEALTRGGRLPAFHASRMAFAGVCDRRRRPIDSVVVWRVEILFDWAPRKRAPARVWERNREMRHRVICVIPLASLWCHRGTRSRGPAPLREVTNPEFRLENCLRP
jgi:hypothetical protein